MSIQGPEDLLRSDARAWLAAIVEGSDDAIVSKTLEGVISTWNQGAERIFGYTAAEAVGRPINMLIPPDRQDEEPRILARIRAGERVEHFETVRVTKDGRLIDVSVTISPVRDASGTIVAASKVARDVTEQRRLQRELRAAMEQAEAANRAKDHFLSVLSHELRTPLTPVLAAVGAIAADPAMPQEELRVQMEMIRRNIETEARLVDDLLDLTRIARGKVQLHFEVADAHAAARNALAMLQGEVDAKGLAVTVALRAKEHHVWADVARLRQVFLNLLSNAVKFTPAGGAVSLKSWDEGGRWNVEVSDNGVGIEPDVLPRIFNAFVQGEDTVTRRFGGLGLGLSIVKPLVEMHKGTVAADSGGKGRGAAFTVSLATVPAVPAGQAPPATPERARNLGRVLLVEDHVDTRMVLRRLLATFGFDVSEAGSVKEAMDVAARQQIDLLVSDIGLPDGSGADVMRHMKERYNVKGIALSGFGQDDDLRRSKEAGFETHLIKPVNFVTLRDVIRKVAS